MIIIYLSGCVHIKPCINYQVQPVKRQIRVEKHGKSQHYVGGQNFLHEIFKRIKQTKQKVSLRHPSICLEVRRVTTRKEKGRRAGGAHGSRFLDRLVESVARKGEKRKKKGKRKIIDNPSAFHIFCLLSCVWLRPFWLLEEVHIILGIRI